MRTIRSVALVLLLIWAVVMVSYVLTTGLPSLRGSSDRAAAVHPDSPVAVFQAILATPWMKYIFGGFSNWEGPLNPLSIPQTNHTSAGMTAGGANLNGSRRELDLVFTFDVTGSMGQYIKEGKNTIQSIVSRIVQQENCDVRFGLVAYRDAPPQDTTFVTKEFTFTKDLSIMQEYLNGLGAVGGGDGPEAVGTALYATEQLPWRTDAAKVVIFITDAPPHGLGELGDNFSNGDPRYADSNFVDFIVLHWLIFRISKP
jgi:von Willebrand factor type A domain